MTLFSRIKAEHISEEEYYTIPACIVDRIDWLQKKQLITLTQDEACELQNCYKQALSWYAQLEVKALTEKEHVVCLNVSTSRLKNVCEKIHALTEKLLKT